MGAARRARADVGVGARLRAGGAAPAARHGRQVDLRPRPAGRPAGAPRTSRGTPPRRSRYSESCVSPRATSTLIEITQIGQKGSSAERAGCSPQRQHIVMSERTTRSDGYGSGSGSSTPSAERGLRPALRARSLLGAPRAQRGSPRARARTARARSLRASPNHLRQRDDAGRRRLEGGDHGLPSRRPSRSADAAVISAVSGPTLTRTRLPSSTSERTLPRTWLTAESPGSPRASETSHGYTATPTRPSPASVENATPPSSSATSVSPSAPAWPARAAGSRR